MCCDSKWGEVRCLGQKSRNPLANPRPVWRHHPVSSGAYASYASTSTLNSSAWTMTLFWTCSKASHLTCRPHPAQDILLSAFNCQSRLLWSASCAAGDTRFREAKGAEAAAAAFLHWHGCDGTMLEHNELWYYTYHIYIAYTYTWFINHLHIIWTLRLVTLLKSCNRGGFGFCHATLATLIRDRKSVV